MMETDGRNTKRKGLAALVALLLHVGVVALLLVLFLPARPAEEPAGGILVNIGDIDRAEGTFNPLPIEPQSQPEDAEVTPSTPAEEAPLLTQETPDAPAVDVPKPTEKPNKDQLERERKLKAQRQADEQRKKAEADERKRQDAIRNKVSGAFGNAQNSKGSGNTPGGSQTGTEGSPFGNVKSGGVNTGVGGWGSYSLGGRSIGKGGLPRPAFTAQVEGTIVIEITVDPSGKVISTNIAPGTTIIDYSMRQSALKSAGQARFEAIDGYNNQVGTITYKYRLN